MPSLRVRGQKRSEQPQGRTSRIRSKLAPAVLQSPKHGMFKCIQWAEESILAVLEAVRSGCSIEQAALEHGVSRSTLNDRVMLESCPWD